jgi:uracil phosphoribosyltransferase
MTALARPCVRLASARPACELKQSMAAVAPQSAVRARHHRVAAETRASLMLAAWPPPQRLRAAPRSRRGACVLRASARPPPMRDAAGNPNTGQMLVFVPPHPLLKHWLAVARSAATPPQTFRSALAELGRLLIYEARAGVQGCHMCVS